MDYAYDLVLTATSEDDVQRSVTTLNTIRRMYNMKISEGKTKTMDLQSKWWSRI
jgi:hypothetical protein